MSNVLKSSEAGAFQLPSMSPGAKAQLPQRTRELVINKPHPKPRVRSYEEQAAEVLQKAKETAAAIEREGYEKGYAQGEKDGRLMGEKRFEATARSVGKLVDEVSKVKERLLAEAADEISALALEFARAVVRAEVACNPGAVLGAVKEATQAMARGSEVTVRLNPRDHAYLTSKGLLPEGAAYVADPGIAAGGCLAESAREVFDARLERQVAALEEVLRGEMSRSDEGDGSGPPA